MSIKPKNILSALFEFLLIVILFVSISVGLTFYRIHKAPLNVDFAIKTIEESLIDEGSNLSTEISQVSIFWPEFKGPILLLLDKVSVLQNGSESFNLDRAAVSIDRSSLLLAQIKPNALILEGTSLKLVRDKNDSVRIALDFGNDKKKSFETPPIKPEDIIDRILNKGSDNDPLYGLDAFEIKDASIFVEDQKQHKTWKVPEFSVVFKRATGKASVDLSYMIDKQLAPTNIKTSISKVAGGYKGDIDIDNLDISLAGKTIGFKEVEGEGMSVHGDVQAVFSNEMNLLNVSVDLEAEKGKLKVPSLFYDRLLDVDSLNVAAKYDAKLSIASIDDLKLSSHGVNLNVSSNIMINDESIKAPLEISIEKVAVDDFEKLLPDVLEGSVAEDWVKTNISVGNFSNLKASIPLLFDNSNNNEWVTSVGDINANFDFDGLTINYHDPLKAVVGVNGSGYFKDDDLNINAVSGNIGDLVTNKTTVVIKDISVAGGGVADIDVHVEGPFKSLLDYIGDDPIALDDKKLGFNKSEVKGIAIADVEVDFPTTKDLKIEEVKVNVKANLTDIYLPNIVKGMPLTGGPMVLKAKDGHFNLSGKGKLDKRPVTLDYTQYLETKNAPYSQKVNAKLIADKKLRNTFGVGLSDYISGDLPLSLTYIEKVNGNAKIDVDVDMTPVEFFIDPLNYNKALGKKGRAKMSIYTAHGNIEEVSDLNIDLHDGHIKNARLIFAKINGESDVKRAQLPDINLPESELSVDLEQTKDQKINVKIGAKKLDIRSYLSKDDNVSSESSSDNEKQTIVSGHVDRLLVSDADNGFFTGAKLYLDVAKTGDINQLEMDARAGNGDIYLRYKPDPFGQLAFRLDASDAGATLKSMGIYEDMVGGTLLIEATRPPGSYKNDLDGIAQITNFKVVNAPALARLLNAMSLPGIQQLLSGDGIEFGKMKTNFKRRKKPSGSELLFSDGRTSGSEVGLTFEGKVNQDTGFVDMKGTMIPLSSLNKVVGQIPIIGQICTGGGALIAATYKMDRKAGEEEINVSVNPLSALTPGILRKILFEGENPAEE